MTEDNHQPPELPSLLRKLGSTLLGMLDNRGELLAVEWQETLRQVKQDRVCLDSLK